MTTTEQRTKLTAEVNDSHHLLETARRTQDHDSAAILCNVMEHQYRLLHLLKLQEQQEAAWVKLPNVKRLTPVMSKVKLAQMLK